MKDSVVNAPAINFATSFFRTATVYINFVLILTMVKLVQATKKENIVVHASAYAQLSTCSLRSSLTLRTKSIPRAEAYYGFTLLERRIRLAFSYPLVYSCFHAFRTKKYLLCVHPCLGADLG